jgi:glycosyltransferase involved in cell wall biosynthesis
MQAKLRVAFNFADVSVGWQGGINYFKSLFLALQATPDTSITPVAFVGRKTNVQKFAFPANVETVRDPAMDWRSPQWSLDRWLSKNLHRSPFASRALLRAGVSLVSHAGPTGTRRIRNIAWIPDFQHLHLPQFFTAKELRERTAAFQSFLRNSEAVLVSSHSARRDLEAFAPRYGHKARVLRFCAVPPKVAGQPPLDLEVTYGIRKPFFYLPNQLWAHKNHLTAVRALAQMTDRPDVAVICSGPLHDYRSPQHLDVLRAEIAKYNLDARFTFLGLIPYPHIAQLMLQATAVINPSLFEGWSTTVEESKALAVPLILSDIDVHREQCPDAHALFFEALAPEQLAARMRDALAHARPPRSEADLKIAEERHLLRMQTFAKEYDKIICDIANGSSAHNALAAIRSVIHDHHT